MNYYISDLHLFHNKIIEKYNRPLSVMWKPASDRILGIQL